MAKIGQIRESYLVNINSTKVNHINVSSTFFFFLFYFILADSMLLFQVQLVGFERQTTYSQLEKFLHFAIWPASVLSLLYYLYRKIVSSSEAEERKNDRRMNKKRR